MKIMMMAVMVMAMSFVANVSKADEPGNTVAAVSETQHFFNPTTADYNAHSKEILAQQAAYVTAKEAKDWSKARSLALFEWVQAWCWFNEAMGHADHSWNDKEALTTMKSLFDSAEASHPTKDCLRKIQKNRAWVEARLLQLNSSK